jgi:hypothetical protein
MARPAPLFPRNGVPTLIIDRILQDINDFKKVKDVIPVFLGGKTCIFAGDARKKEKRGRIELGRRWRMAHRSYQTTDCL